MTACDERTLRIKALSRCQWPTTASGKAVNNVNHGENNAG